MSACCVYLPSTRGGEGGVDGWLGISAAPAPSLSQQHTTLSERKALHKNPWFHLPVLLGRSEHLSELSPSSTRGVPACLCPARRHQRTDSTVSDGGHMHQDVVFLLYHNTDLSLQPWRRCFVRTQVASRWSVGAHRRRVKVLYKFWRDTVTDSFMREYRAVMWLCCCHKHCHCINGFPDSPVCISVSQLRCGDFLTLIASLCCVHISWHIGCWVKHVE